MLSAVGDLGRIDDTSAIEVVRARKGGVWGVKEEAAVALLIQGRWSTIPGTAFQHEAEISLGTWHRAYYAHILDVSV